MCGQKRKEEMEVRRRGILRWWGWEGGLKIWWRRWGGLWNGGQGGRVGMESLALWSLWHQTHFPLLRYSPLQSLSLSLSCSLLQPSTNECQPIWAAQSEPALPLAGNPLGHDVSRSGRTNERAERGRPYPYTSPVSGQAAPPPPPPPRLAGVM